MEITYRYCTLDDFDQILGLIKQLWPDKQLSRNEMSKVYTRGLQSIRDFLICAVVDGGIAGFGCMVVKNSFWQESYVGYITTLVVDEEQRNRGIGKGLISMLSEIAKNEGCKRIELDSGFHREQAHMFYEKIGFNKRAYLFSKVL